MGGTTTKVVDREYLKAQFKNFNDILVKPKIQDLDDRKMDKVAGKGLSTNDFTDDLKTKLEGLSNYDDTELVNAINTLNGDINTEGSVAKTTADAVAAIVASAPSDFDTLKEISDWISSHADSAAAMNSAIQANTQAITLLNSDENTEGSVAYAVKQAVDSLAYEIEDSDIDFTELDKITIAFDANNEFAFGDASLLTETSSGEYALALDIAEHPKMSLISDVEGVTWSSNNTDIVIVENGVVRAVGENGEATITVSKTGYTPSHIAVSVRQ